MKKLLLSLMILALGFSTYAQNEQKHAYKFEQLGTMLRSAKRVPYRLRMRGSSLLAAEGRLQDQSSPR